MSHGYNRIMFAHMNAKVGRLSLNLYHNAFAVPIPFTAIHPSLHWSISCYEIS